MTGLPIKSNNSHGARPAQLQLRRSFWHSPLNYYLFAGAVGTCSFFICWGVLTDAGDETAWLTAAIAVGALMFGAVIMRELVLKKSRIYALKQNTLVDSHRLDSFPRLENVRTADKLTVERNAALVREIGRKSDAAEVLGSFAAVHREIFELCDAYLVKNDAELRNIGAGSPRLGPLRKGRDTVSRYHRYHLLRWAEIETATLNRQAMEKAGSQEKVESAQSALGIIDYALGFYPEDRSLLDSRAALSEITVSLEVSGLVEEAERAVFQGDLKGARKSYRDALFRLGRETANNGSRELAAERIIAEIQKLDRVDNGDGSGMAFAD